ncbi:hypothetical protein C8Q76DRAFT_760739 [Earliella scabrosa]|nr:hypothetical protein C8Q76DRAFT_760739 [Earliella scabrosa]
MARTAEFTKRAHEYVAKLKAILDSNFGETIDNMFEIQALATHPAKQGRGYGTALVKVVNDMADTQARATYVVTTDAYRFYETVGYELVGEDWLGVDNPAWTGAPVPLRVVSCFQDATTSCIDSFLR